MLLGLPLAWLLLVPGGCAARAACAGEGGRGVLAWRLLDVTAAALLVAAVGLPYLGELVMAGSLGGPLRQMASVESLELKASWCPGAWVLASAAALETVAAWLP